jgi:CubicO group peptidase (beta-lactamase class C family)
MIRAVVLSVALLLARSTSSFAEIRSKDCERAAKYSDERRGVSMLVVQNGQTVFEHYSNGGAANGARPIFSGTKSFWGIVALCAVNDGLVRLDEHVADTITEWKSDARKSQITVRQLLNQTDGIEASSHLQSASMRDRNAIAIRLSILAEPGTRFIYGPSHLQIFGELLRRKLSGRSTISYIEEKLLHPLGIGSVEYKRDARGNPLLATGFELSARQWAQFGEMILGHGNYHGRQIVTASLLREAFTGSSANPSYGLTFWLNRNSGREIDIEKELDLPWERARWIDISICRAAPNDMVVALGSNQQRLYVIPSLNAVIVRQGRESKFSDGKFLRLVLNR